MSKFEWPRIHKWEENIEREITDSVHEYVCEFYGVEDTNDLNEDQIRELDQFREYDLNEYSPMQIGISNIINAWESNLEDIK